MRILGSLTALALAAALAAAPFEARSQVLICDAPTEEEDFDADGWSDAQECAEVLLLPGLTVVGPDGIPSNNVPSCFGNEFPRETQGHSPAADAADWTGDGKLDLLIGGEDGFLYFFDRNFLERP